MRWIRPFFASRMIVILLPAETVSVTLVISRTFILNVASYNVRTETIREKTGGHYCIVKNLTEKKYIYIAYICQACFGIP